MWKKLVLTSLTGLMLTVGIKPTLANTVIENIVRSGKFTVGTPFDSVPYAYFDGNDELTGFSVDLVKLIHQQLEQDLGREITLDFVKVDSFKEAVPKVMTGEIDLVCNAIFTWQRDQYVDFSLRYTISGIRLLVPKNSLTQNNSSLAGKKIGIPPLTFVRDVIKLAHPQAQLVEVATVREGAIAVKEGKLDALAGDTLILDGISQQIDVNAFDQFPPLDQRPYAQYGVGCIVPQNNSAFLNTANFTIAKMMEGYLNGDPEMTKMVNKWVVGPQGVVSVLTEDQIKKFFEATIMNHEQIPFDKK